MADHDRVSEGGKIKQKEKIQRALRYQPQCASLDNPDSTSGTTTATLFVVIVCCDYLANGQKSIQNRDHRRIITAVVIKKQKR